MKVKNTSLEYNEAEKTCLEFFLSEDRESLEKWAERIWENCQRFKDGESTDRDGNKLAEIYKEDPHFLWEQKKRRRRAGFVKEMTGEDCDKEILSKKKICEDIENNRECNWPATHQDVAVQAIKSDPAKNYKTATQASLEEKQRLEQEKAASDAMRLENVTKLRAKGFDDEVIGVIYPKGKSFLN